LPDSWNRGHAMTYMGEPYYPVWLDNLADDVTLEGAAMSGTAQGAEAVRSIVVAARALYEEQTFSFAGEFDDDRFIELYSCNILGEPTRVVVVVERNDEGKTQSLAVLHRPRKSVMVFSHAMYEKFKGTPVADFFLAEAP
jgi:hypothetical protein